MDMTKGHASLHLCRQTPDPGDIPVAGPSQARNKKEGRLVFARHDSRRWSKLAKTTRFTPR